VTTRLPRVPARLRTSKSPASSRAAPDDVDGIKIALVELHSRFANGGLPSVELAARDEERLSRRARVEEMAQLLEEVA